MNKSSLLSWLPALTLFPAVFRISGRPVCVTMAAVFVFRELLVFTFYHCVYYIGRPSLFPPSVPPSPPSRTLHVLIQILMLSISPLQEFLTVFFFFFPVSFSPTFSPLPVYLSAVWPGPGHPHSQCMYPYLFYLSSSTSSNLHLTKTLPLPALCHPSVCMYMLTMRLFILVGNSPKSYFCFTW